MCRETAWLQTMDGRSARSWASASALFALSYLLFALDLSSAQPQLPHSALPQPGGLLKAIGEEKVVMCQASGTNCQSLDPCGTQCGVGRSVGDSMDAGRCWNLDDSCLGEGLLKFGRSCGLLWAEVPPGVELTFYNLWGPWSFNTNDCAAQWSCYYWIWPFRWVGVSLGC